MSRMETLISTNGPLLQHIEDSARTGDVLIRETRGISVGILDLAQRLDSNAKFDGRVRELRICRAYCFNAFIVSSGSSPKRTLNL